MITINYLKEEEKAVNKTYRRFVEEYFKTSLVDEDWMEPDRYDQFSRLYECLNKDENAEFIADSLVDDEEPDNFSKIAQMNMAYDTITDKKFIVLLSGQSLTNRIVTACEKKQMYPEIAYRLRQCIWIYQLLIGDFGNFEEDWVMKISYYCDLQW